MDDTYTFYKKGYIFFLITCETFTKKFLSHTYTQSKTPQQTPSKFGWGGGRGGRFILRNWLIGRSRLPECKSDGVGPAALGTQGRIAF